MRSVVAVGQTSEAASAEHIHRQNKAEEGEQSIRDAEQRGSKARGLDDSVEREQGQRRAAERARRAESTNVTNPDSARCEHPWT